jgi:abortive infection bacteriophage resistance protein
MFFSGIFHRSRVAQLKREFDKPPLTINEQIELLIARGLNISDCQQAENYLSFIGYYRLSAYTLPFQNSDGNRDRHDFRLGTTFEQILDLYIFDRKLRLLVMDAIERIEVAIKATISNVISTKHSSHWFLKPELFERNSYESCLTQIKKDINYDNPGRQEKFIKHYYATYDRPILPPSWMVMEVLMLGTVSKLYSNLRIDIQKEIASLFEVDHSVLKSWLYSLSSLRNLCAHHSRLWNRTFTIKPKILKNVQIYMPDNDKFFAQAFVLIRMLRKISQDTHWEDRLERLFDEYSEVDTLLMGFTSTWKYLPIWE